MKICSKSSEISGKRNIDGGTRRHGEKEGRKRKDEGRIEQKTEGGRETKKKENLGNGAAFDFFYTPLEFEKFILEGC